MQIQNSVAIVTGAGSGIGRALAESFAAAGARVVASDLDPASAEQTAAQIRSGGGQALGMRADAGLTADIEALNATEFGPADIYVANAGIIGAPGLGSDETWDGILDINLRAHIRAAQVLVPQWLSRGGGYFVSVASAAGLLSQIGAAGYAVTKHDAVRSSSDPDAAAGAASIVQSGEVISAQQVAAATVDAVQSDKFLVLPHPQVLDMYRHKGSDYDRWIAGMRRYQRSLRAGR